MAFRRNDDVLVSYWCIIGASGFACKELAVYRRFFDTLRFYQKRHRTIKQMYKQVLELLRDKADFHDELTHFRLRQQAVATSPQRHA